MRHIIPALSLGLLVGCLPGHSCNAMYSPDQVLVDFGGFAFEEGVWTVEFDDIRCEVELPGAGGDWTCVGGEAILMLSEDGADIDEVSVWEFAPETFAVRLSLDGELVAEQTFSPVYDIDEPNGRGCGERAFTTVVFTGG